MDQIDTQIIMKVMQSGCQTTGRLIICTQAILFWAYSYPGLSNFGRFGQIFWRIIRPLTKALWQCSVVFSAYSVTRYFSCPHCHRYSSSLEFYCSWCDVICEHSLKLCCFFLVSLIINSLVAVAIPIRAVIVYKN